MLGNRRIESVIAFSAFLMAGLVGAPERGWSQSEADAGASAAEQQQGSGSSSSGQTRGAAPAAGGSLMNQRLTIFGVTGFGGALDDVETEAEANGNTNSSETDFEDMQATFGFGAGYEYPLARNITLGGRLSAVWYRSDRMEDSDFDRFILVNIDAAPKVRLPILRGEGEVYATVPVGLTLNPENDDMEEDIFGQEADIGTGISWNISLLGGIHYSFSSNIGGFIEGGFYNQAIHWTAEAENTAGTDVEVDVTGNFAQFGLNAGISIAL